MPHRMPRILVFASGSRDGGGTGFLRMVENTRTSPPILVADIVGVVSNHALGGVQQKAAYLGTKFHYWPGPFIAAGYQDLVKKFRADYVMLSGWLYLVRGLEPAKTVNIHPGPLPGFGGPGLYGHHVHEAVMKSYNAGTTIQSTVTIHFVTEEYDCGPVIAAHPVLIRPYDTAKTLAERMLGVEHVVQSIVLDEVVHGRIYLGDDGQVHHRPR